MAIWRRLRLDYDGVDTITCTFDNWTGELGTDTSLTHPVPAGLDMSGKVGVDIFAASAAFESFVLDVE